MMFLSTELGTSFLVFAFVVVCLAIGPVQHWKRGILTVV